MKSILARSPKHLKAAALVGSGVAGVARRRNVHQASILTFHGFSEGVGDSDVLDWGLHLPVSMFRRICAFLASNYHVIPLRELVKCLETGTKPPPNAVVLTFDDGYESNYRLAYPVLKEFSLPGTIFAATGFLDGEEMLWFQRVDLALGRTEKPYLDWKFELGKERLPLKSREQRRASLARLLPELKRLPDEDALSEIDRIERSLGLREPTVDDLPAPMRPMTWDQAREMSASSLVEIGGHTHTHPILARCDSAAMRGEIFTCRDRLTTELGTAPRSFCYTNGGRADYTDETLSYLREAGFVAAVTMEHGRVLPDTPLLELPRYGSPESVWEAEATVSGAYDTVKQWRQAARRIVTGAST